MKKLAILFASMFIMAIAVQNVNAQGISAEDEGTATAKILEVITITADEDLEFGSIAAGTTASDIKVTPAGVRSVESGNARLYTSGPGQAGTFNVTGEDNATYAITLPANGVVTLAGPSTALVVKDFTSSPTPTGTLDGSGLQTINIGATVVIPAGQAPGDYTGVYTVKVNYN